MATDTLHIQNDLTFTGLLPADTVNLFAGNQLLIDANKIITADVAHFGLVTSHSLSLEGVAINNSVGEIDIYAGENVSLFNNGSLNTAGFLNLRALGNLDINGNSTVSMLAGTLAASGNIGITLDNSSLTVIAGGSALNVIASKDISLLNNASITTPDFLNLQAGQNLSIDGSTLNFASADLTAGDTFTLGDSSLIVAGGNLYIASGSHMNIMNSVIDPASSITMYSFGGDIDIQNSEISADSAAGAFGSIDIAAFNGTLTIDQGSGPAISAGGSIALSGQNEVDIQNTTIESLNAGHVNITSGAGMVSLNTVLVNSPVTWQYPAVAMSASLIRKLTPVLRAESPRFPAAGRCCWVMAPVWTGSESTAAVRQRFLAARRLRFTTPASTWAAGWMSPPVQAR